MADKILLGHGKFTVGDVPIGLTRGGGSFVVEREFRNIEADGDKGPVKGRIALDTETAKLTLKALDMFTAADMTKFYPSLALTTDKLTSTLAIAETDHVDINWVGKTLDGQAVTINLNNAINMGNIEWTLEDKNEVVPELELTACYDPSEMGTAPWSVQFASA